MPRRAGYPVCGVRAVVDERTRELNGLKRQALRDAYKRLAEYERALDAMGFAHGYADGFRAGVAAAKKELSELVASIDA